MKQVGVDGWRQVSCLGMPEKYAVMGGAPDRHPATFTAKPPEIVLKPVTLPAPSVLTFEDAVLLDERGAMSFETIHLLAGCEDIGGTLGDITDRPGQQRRYDRLGNPRCPVLTNLTIARDARRRSSGPRLE